MWHGSSRGLLTEPAHRIAETPHQSLMLTIITQPVPISHVATLFFLSVKAVRIQVRAIYCLL